MPLQLTYYFADYRTLRAMIPLSSSNAKSAFIASRPHSCLLGFILPGMPLYRQVPRAVSLRLAVGIK